MKDAQKKAAKRMKWITHKAKEIQRKHPNTGWQSAIKKAGEKYCKCKGKKKSD